MAKDLPDEMISEILSPVLEVPEHKFSDLSPTSPFAKYSVSSSALLLVCKAWLRVATPLLYHVVILRSRAQARALHDALQKNKDLGRFVKKLRVEGGFGRFMQHVLHSSPNITDLFISLQIHESDSTSGFAAALPSINPTRVIIFDDHENRLKNKEGVLQLMSSLSGCVNNWTNLHTLVLPYPTSVPSRHNFVLSMCAGSNLKIVSFPFPSTSPDITPLLIEIAKHPGLEAVELRQKSTQKQLSLPTSNNARLTSLLRWADDPVPRGREYRLTISQPTDPSFQPLASVTREVAERIWSRILFFAMLSKETVPHNTKLKMKYERLSNCKRAQFLRVSKSFHRLALPYLYRYLILQCMPLRRLAVTLQATAVFGEHIHELELRGKIVASHTFRRLSADRYPFPTNLESIFRCMPRLRRLACDGDVSLPWNAFCALAETAGGTLEEMIGFVFDSGFGHPPDVLEHLTALRSFTWKSTSSVRSPGVPRFFDTTAVPKAALPALELLSVWNHDPLPLLTQMDLPSLRRVDMHKLTASSSGSPQVAAFLRKHGNNIWWLRSDTPIIGTQCVLGLCPNLSTLWCSFDPRNNYNIGAQRGFQHAYLTKLVISKNNELLRATEAKNVSEWEDFFSTLDVTHLPGLTELHVPVCVWPTTEHEIAQSMWVKAAENLQKRGIKLTDEVGDEWHPRLK